MPTKTDVPYKGIKYYSEELWVTQEANHDIQQMKEAGLYGKNPEDLALQPEEFWILWNVRTSNELPIAF